MLDLRHYSILLMIALLVFSFAPVRVHAQSSPTSPVGFSVNTNTELFAGEVFHDGNFNGIREIDEKEMQGISVTLETLEGAILQKVQSELDGYYVFTDLPEGQFRIRVWPPKGYNVTRNGTYTINTHEPQATVVQSTGLFLGIFLPNIQR